MSARTLFTRSLPRSRPFAGSSAFNLSVAQRYRDICFFFYLRCDKPGLVVVAKFAHGNRRWKTFLSDAFGILFFPLYRLIIAKQCYPPSKELVSSQEFFPRPRRVELNFFLSLSLFPLHTLIKNLKDLGGENIDPNISKQGFYPEIP